MHPNYLNVVK